MLVPLRRGRESRHEQQIEAVEVEQRVIGSRRKWECVVIEQVFIKENRGSFSTCLGKIRFFGKPTHALTVCVRVLI